METECFSLRTDSFFCATEERSSSKEDGEPFFGTGLRRQGRDVVCREIEFCPVILDGAESASICTKKPVEQKNTGL